MKAKGIALPLIKEVAEKAKLKKKQENTFEGQGVKEENPREVVDTSEMPDAIKIPGMDTPESATNIKILASQKTIPSEKKRASIMGADHNIEEQVQPEAVNKNSDNEGKE
ncbi:hypothetical protein FG386_002323 [Cryptosporidium ryanae]|uniref:uncharacterized protein n=1 Tax=Cryptosporidium ryanae TaxID=515981 RepID=UPI00351A4D92|nr:hypothetical protein FG386_002323 [Cryptosporidium ryanae]